MTKTTEGLQTLQSWKLPHASRSLKGTKRDCRSQTSSNIHKCYTADNGYHVLQCSSWNHHHFTPLLYSTNWQFKSWRPSNTGKIPTGTKDWLLVSDKLKNDSYKQALRKSICVTIYKLNGFFTTDVSPVTFQCECTKSPSKS